MHWLHAFLAAKVRTKNTKAANLADSTTEDSKAAKAVDS